MMTLRNGARPEGLALRKESFDRQDFPLPALGAKQLQRHFAGLLVKLRFQLQPERATFEVSSLAGAGEDVRRTGEGCWENPNRRNGLSSGVVSG